MRMNWVKNKASSTIYHFAAIWSCCLLIFIILCFRPSLCLYRRFFLYVNLIQCFLKLIISMPLFNSQYNVKMMISLPILACLCTDLPIKNLIMWQSKACSQVFFNDSLSYLITIIYQVYDQSVFSFCDICLC